MIHLVAAEVAVLGAAAGLVLHRDDERADSGQACADQTNGAFSVPVFIKDPG